MAKTRVHEQIDRERRAAPRERRPTVAAAQFGISTGAQARPTSSEKRSVVKVGGVNKSFGPLRQIEAGPLSIAYAEIGPIDGSPVILLHGWPYDIFSFVDVAPALASAHYRVIVPYVRGYGSTKFLSGETMRNGQPAAVAAKSSR